AGRPLLHDDEAIAGRQEHAVIQLVGDGPGALLQSDKVEDVVIAVQHALDFDGSAVIMAMKTLAFFAFIADEMAGTEDEIILLDVYAEFFRHGVYRRPREIATPRLSYPFAGQRTRKRSPDRPSSPDCAGDPRLAARRPARSARRPRQASPIATPAPRD